jgi:hypothetical protein
MGKEKQLMVLNGDIVKSRDYPEKEYIIYWYDGGSGELR